MAEIENRVTTLEQQVSNVMTKLDMFIEESREARQRHDAEIRELRQRQEAAQLKHDADMKEMQKNIYAKMDSMDTKIDGMGKHVRNLAITSMAAIGGMVVAVVAMVVAVFLK
ncbi:MAG: hypothetical protein IKP64_10020 [Selenomonadaceae bacterium]|nr:hypothetical protein [Selenomonadaceae bacterium]MBR4383879.1 hypothetical protein [Selenomonadaceae bacterium]